MTEDEFRRGSQFLHPLLFHPPHLCYHLPPLLIMMMMIIMTMMMMMVRIIGNDDPHGQHERNPCFSCSFDLGYLLFAWGD